MAMRRLSVQVAALVAVAWVAAGCELLSTIDRSKIPSENGGAGGTTSASTSTSATGGTGGTGGTPSTTTTSATGGTGGTGGTGTTTTATGGGGTGGTTTTSSSSGTECTKAADCPQGANECDVATCVNGFCGMSQPVAGTPIAAQTAGDCQTAVCNGLGAITSVADPTDVFDDGNACTDDACNGISPTNKPKAAGAVCATGVCDGASACVECLDGAQCATGFCSAQHACASPACGDLAQNGTETDVDCGGSCSACATGKHCAVNADCQSALCKIGVCAAPTCTDLLKNGTETDVDCGGTCSTKCAPGKGCTVNGDCVGGSCSGTVCLPTCTDLVKNGGETDVDCGGTACAKCADDKVCAANSDCTSGVCTGGKCQAPTCTDLVKNAAESDVDCGGGACGKCGTGKDCGATTDCLSGVCTGGKCQAATCTDTVKNGTESDVDCGGLGCPKCALGQICGSATDCASAVCTGGLCGAAVCGDGIKSPGEACDDGNKASGDGCSAACAMESGFTCNGAPSVCTTTCGDGVKAGAEGCDDSNTASGDGCSATCVVESGWNCTGSPSVCQSNCGDGVVGPGETCDDSNTAAGDGCSASCQTEAGYQCTGAPSACATVCGDGIVKGGETCDDGNTAAGDGCSATCQTEAGFQCAGAPSACTGICGDGIVKTGETCDDGNKAAGDGCSATCQTETGYQCTGAPSACTGICGDGIKLAIEPCDDGNTTAGDGCSATCAVELGFTCAGSPSVCGGVCGDALIRGAETCDDANAAGGDGCSATCQTETGYQCAGVPSACTGICGDGIKLAIEPCDDNNTTSGDGCSATCAVELGFSCTGAGPSVCAANCGDSLKLGAETCDDGNTAAGDGCSAVCAVEQYWTCTGTPSVCSGICGDGQRVGTEQCDDGNTANGDCCSSGCLVEAGCEIEPNNNKDQAHASGNVLTSGVVYKGKTTPAGDIDFWELVLTQTSNVKLETFDATGPSNCTTIDTQMYLYAADGTTQVATDDDGGPGSCSLLDPAASSTVRNLAAGTYYVKVNDYSNNDVISYTVRATVTPVTCGDNVIVSPNETCDDGNTAAGDGCSAACATETGWTCTGTPSVCTRNCGNGVIGSGETCDDSNFTAGDGCSATCTIEPGYTCTGTPSVCTFTCGNGTLSGNEKCDDGNTTNGDGCSATCQFEATAESEPNDVTACATATAYTIPTGINGRLFSGSISPAADVDYYRFTIPVYADLWFETFDANGPSTCATLDTKIQLYKADCTTAVSTSQDQGGVGSCSRLNPVTQATAMTHLAPGTYALAVADYYGTSGTYNYTLLAKYVAYCGNGAVEGSEECDGGAGCGSDCKFIAVCGDGVKQSGETCDDSNTVDGDGCSSTCQIEATAETESNNTCLTANGPYTIPAGSFGMVLSGTLSSSTDQDWYTFTTTAYTDLSFRTWDQTSLATCANPLDTVIQLYKSDCTTAQSASQDQGATLNCSLLDGTTQASAMKHLPPGTYALKVNAYSSTSIGSYFLQAKYTALCGNGVVEGSEQCDGGAGCGADCMLLAVCGNGNRENGEQCDDGNTTAGDGCSATCTVEATAEAEANNTCSVANGPYTIPAGSFGMVLSGSLSASTDQDWYTFTTTAYTDLSFQTFDQVSLGTCATIDTGLQLYKSDCTTTQSSAQDQGGIGSCSKLDGTTQATAMKHVPPGTYALKVYGYSSTTIGAYFLQAKYTAVCGNGVIEGSEQCDGGALCGSDCVLLPVCGNGIVSGTEICDDGNLVNGDGCDSTCNYEGFTNEVEPNNTTAQADANGLVISSDAYYIGSIAQVGDKDVYKLVVGAASAIRFETFQTDSPRDCTSISTTLRVYNSTGTQVQTDTTGAGIGSCAALVWNFAAGTYYVQVEHTGNTAAIAKYFLQVKFLGDTGSETEANNVYTAANTNLSSATDSFVSAVYTASADADWFAITVAAGQSIRAEIIEASSSGTTCESNNMDSKLDLYNPAGATSLVFDNDDGRGFCSLIDGTGATPRDAGAHNLAAGTYFLRVTGYSVTFNYRLAVTVR